LLLTLRLNYDKYGNHEKVVWMPKDGVQRSSQRTKGDKLKIKMKITRITSLNALLIAAGSLLFSISAHATVIDIEPAGSSGTINGALFFESDQQPAGTGFIQSFLRVQGHPAGPEQGYNTDGGFPFDDKNPHNFQHSIELSSLSQFNISGTEYFKFMLDANQSGGPHGSFTLNQLQIYTSNDPAQTTTTFNADGTLPLGHLAYNMNIGGGTDNSVITHSTGSGHFDAAVYIPVSAFNQSDRYVILYMQSNTGTGGFEEWVAATGVNPVPEVTPASVIFGFLGLIVAVSSRRALAGRVSAIARRGGTK
jgi:hypothetical protein